uniref:Fungal lipase-type domain-containing protein n=1 Tax=viral metagenome TaxID=1070528 RepID=A0A6C0CJX5_9ZZZZ
MYTLDMTTIIKDCGELSKQVYSEPEKILKGWKKSGLLEVEPRIVLDEATDTESMVSVYSKKVDGLVYKYIVVAVRGTESFTDVLKDLDVRKTQPTFVKKHYDHLRVKVHNGFYEQYQAIRPRIFNHIKRLQAKHNLSRVIFTGHSLGAAVASILALSYKMNHTGMNVSCVTFGSPRVGNKYFAKSFDIIDHSYRVVNYQDPVCKIPSRWRFRHVKGVVLMKDKKVIYGERQSFFRSLWSGISLGSHRMDYYIYKMGYLFR